MRRHVRNHKGERAFTCEHCGQSFVRREVWRRHEGLHLNPQSARPRIKPVRRPDAAAPLTSANMGTSQPITRVTTTATTSSSSSGPHVPAVHPPPIMREDRSPLENYSPPQYAYGHTEVDIQPVYYPPPHWVQQVDYVPHHIPPPPSAHPHPQQSGYFPQAPTGIENWLDQIITPPQAGFGPMNGGYDTTPPKEVWPEQEYHYENQNGAVDLRLREYFFRPQPTPVGRPIDDNRGVRRH